MFQPVVDLVSPSGITYTITSDRWVTGVLYAICCWCWLVALRMRECGVSAPHTVTIQRSNKILLFVFSLGSVIAAVFRERSHCTLALPVHILRMKFLKILHFFLLTCGSRTQLVCASDHHPKIQVWYLHPDVTYDKILRRALPPCAVMAGRWSHISVSIWRFTSDRSLCFNSFNT